ncbi:hypothetical protein Tco_0856104 [Tanacetum coccineum]
MSFIKRSDTAPVCHSKPLDSVKNWNDHFFWVDSTAFPLSVSLKSKILSKDPPPKLSRYDVEACEFLRTHTSPFRKFPEPFLCWVGISRHYTLDENSYPTFWDGEEEMDLFAFIRHSDPTKVRVRERNLAEREVKLLEMTEGRTVPLNPPATAASGDSGDSIDKMFDEENDDNQEHLVAKDNDVLEEVVALDAPGVGAEKAKKKRKRNATGDASGSVYPPKKLRDDYQPLPPSTGGKSITALRRMIPDGSVIPSDAADVPVVTVAVTTTVDANVATCSKAKDAPKDIEHIGDYVSSGGVDADAASISKLKKPSISSDSFYASQSLDTKTMHRVYVPRWKLRAMDYDQLYSEFNVGAARQVCLGAEVRMRAEHTLERKSELEDRCAEQTTLLSEKDAEIAHLRSLLSLKETEAAEAISLRNQLSVVEAADAAKALESMATSKEDELAPLSSQVASLTADLSGFQLSRDELISRVASLESKRDCLATQVEKMQDEQVRVLSDRVAGIDSDLI